MIYAGLHQKAKKISRIIADEAAKLGRDDNRFKDLISHAMRSESQKAINDMIACAASEPELQAKYDDFDSHPYLLNCSNGVVDLKTGESTTTRPQLYAYQNLTVCI